MEYLTQGQDTVRAASLSGIDNQDFTRELIDNFNFFNTISLTCVDIFEIFIDLEHVWGKQMKDIVLIVLNIWCNNIEFDCDQ